MNCKEFHQWLATRDIHEPILPNEAVAHMAQCRSCERLFHCDSRLEDAIRKGMRMEELPRGLAEKISASLDQQSPSRPSIRTKAVIASLALLAVVLIAFYFPFSQKPAHQFKDLNQIGTDAVRGHLAGNRHMTFTAEDIDQALSLLTEELGFQVLLPDLEHLGCTLRGGRLCGLGKCRAAYFILDRNGKAGSLYVVDTRFLSFGMADGSRFNTRIKGCEADVWKENGQVYAMVF